MEPYVYVERLDDKLLDTIVKHGTVYDNSACAYKMDGVQKKLSDISIKTEPKDVHSDANETSTNCYEEGMRNLETFGFEKSRNVANQTRVKVEVKGETEDVRNNHNIHTHSGETSELPSDNVQKPLVSVKRNEYAKSKESQFDMLVNAAKGKGNRYFCWLCAKHEKSFGDRPHLKKHLFTSHWSEIKDIVLYQVPANDDSDLVGYQNISEENQTDFRLKSKVSTKRSSSIEVTAKVSQRTSNESSTKSVKIGKKTTVSQGSLKDQSKDGKKNSRLNNKGLKANPNKGKARKNESTDGKIHTDGLSGDIDAVPESQSENTNDVCGPTEKASKKKARAGRQKQTNEKESVIHDEFSFIDRNENGKFSCSKCDSEFTTRNNLRRHNHFSHKGGSKENKCEICGEAFITKKGLEQHCDLLHSRITEETPPKSKGIRLTEWSLVQRQDDGMFHCSESGCDLKFKLRSSLKRHVCNIHRDNWRQQTCEHCGVRVHSKLQLERHVVLHTGEKKYKCSICDKCFGHPTYLRKHERLVHGVNRGPMFQCDLCPREFTRKRYVEAHRRIHTGEKPFECKFCDKRFRRSNELRLHIPTHSNERVTCEYCGKTFPHKRNLRLHVRGLHETENNPKCEFCGKIFRYKYLLDSQV